MYAGKVRHPEYIRKQLDFIKWRSVYTGGKDFVDRYLRKFSSRESTADFEDRKNITYNPAFAKVGINKLKNTFYSRMSEIIRRDGPDSYIQACRGEAGGVDLYGTSINQFMGQSVLKELMIMGCVGVWVDKPSIGGPLLSDNQGKKPYLYLYFAEDILTWNYTYSHGEYCVNNILLRDRDFVYDPENGGLVVGIEETYRHAFMGADGKVHIKFYRPNLEKPEEPDTEIRAEVILDLPRIPFVPGGLTESLLTDVADYQISMLNIASADMNYCYKANFPFYTEQYDPIADNMHLRRIKLPTGISVETAQDPAQGTATEAAKAGTGEEVIAGALRGRRYPKGLESPEFIAPPTDPLLASMKKQEQMKQDIFELIDIAASNAKPQFASAESKQMDDRGLESGLSNIGLELEYMEREIGKIWALYENGKPPDIKYPDKYSLKTDEQRNKEAEQLRETKSAVPSPTFNKEVCKQISRVLLKDKAPNMVLDKIDKEIDNASFLTSDPETIKIASELGMVDAVTGSNALGFDGEKVVPKAQEEHAKRLAVIAENQAKGAARGNPDASTPQDTSAKDEKKTSQSSDNNPDPGKKVRD